MSIHDYKGYSRQSYRQLSSVEKWDLCQEEFPDQLAQATDEELAELAATDWSESEWASWEQVKWLKAQIQAEQDSRSGDDEDDSDDDNGEYHEHFPS